MNIIIQTISIKIKHHCIYFSSNDKLVFTWLESILNDSHMSKTPKVTKSLSSSMFGYKNIVKSISQTHLVFLFHCNVWYMVVCHIIHNCVCRYPLMIISKIIKQLIFIHNSNKLTIHRYLHQYTWACISTKLMEKYYFTIAITHMGMWSFYIVV